MTQAWTTETLALVERACADPGSVCGRLSGETVAAWTAHAVLALLDAAPEIRRLRKDLELNKAGWQVEIDGLKAIEADRDWLRGLWETELAATTAVRHLHSQTIDNACAACDLPYPCRTIRTLDQHTAVVSAPLISAAGADIPQPERVNGDG